MYKVPRKDEFAVTSDVEKFLRLSLSHPEEYTVEVFGKRLYVHPQVMSPKYSYSPLFFMEKWDIADGMSVLEIGTGSGILSIFAAFKGAAQVVATDLNPFAAHVAEKNVQFHSLSHIVTVKQADVFAGLPTGETFDRVLFNAPFWNKKPDPLIQLTYGVFDEDYHAARAFLAGAIHYLKPDGKVLLGFSYQDDISFFESIIDNSLLHIEKKMTETFGHTRVLYYLSR